MHTNLQAYLDHHLAAPEFAIHYHIGDDFNGETELRLRGDGHYTLESNVIQDRQRKTYQGQVTTERVAQVVQSLQAAHVWEAHHIHPRPAEDDPEAIIAVTAAGKEARVVLWVSEIAESPPFQAAQRALLALVQELSHGEVLEGGQ